VLNLEDIALLHLAGAGFPVDVEAVVAAAGGFLAELVDLTKLATHKDLGGEFVCGDEG